MLKYMTSDKGDFQNVHYEALYLRITWKKHLINSFGEWYNVKFSLYKIELKIFCKKCKQQIQFKYDRAEVDRILYEQNKPPPDVINPQLNEMPKIEVVKI